MIDKCIVFLRVAPLELTNSYDYPSASEVTMNGLGKSTISSRS